MFDKKQQVLWKYQKATLITDSKICAEASIDLPTNIFKNDQKFKDIDELCSGNWIITLIYFRNKIKMISKYLKIIKILLIKFF